MHAWLDGRLARGLGHRASCGPEVNGDADCFGFNNENYLVPDLRLPDHVVGQGASRVVVRVAAGALVRIAEFQLHNPGTKLNDFALTPGAPHAVWEQ